MTPVPRPVSSTAQRDEEEQSVEDLEKNGLDDGALKGRDENDVEDENGNDEENDVVEVAPAGELPLRRNRASGGQTRKTVDPAAPAANSTPSWREDKRPKRGGSRGSF